MDCFLKRYRFHLYSWSFIYSCQLGWRAMSSIDCFWTMQPACQWWNMGHDTSNRITLVIRSNHMHRKSNMRSNIRSYGWAHILPLGQPSIIVNIWLLCREIRDFHREICNFYCLIQDFTAKLLQNPWFLPRNYREL